MPTTAAIAPECDSPGKRDMYVYKCNCIVFYVVYQHCVCVKFIVVVGDIGVPLCESLSVCGFARCGGRRGLRRQSTSERRRAAALSAALSPLANPTLTTDWKLLNSIFVDSTSSRLLLP
ncbi:unnamed protein product [Leptosia nina]|uniref:Uncharacterized protein n=1 Tax=Leptosia nina TaxID=320188 RepID=A0AAV1K5K1_9NEOP